MSITSDDLQETADYLEGRLFVLEGFIIVIVSNLPQEKVRELSTLTKENRPDLVLGKNDAFRRGVSLQLENINELLKKLTDKFDRS